MNSNAPNTSHDDAYQHLDADLAALSRTLDDVGAADRALLRSEAVARIGAASLASLHGIMATSAQFSELGAIDRAAGDADLEDRVFEASRAELAGHVLRLTGDGTLPAGRLTVRAGWSAGRIRVLSAAAALLLASAGVMTYIGLRPAAVSDNARPIAAGNGTQQSVEALAAMVNTQMDTLFVAMEGLPTTSTEQSGGEFRPEWLDDLGTPGAGGGGAS